MLGQEILLSINFFYMQKTCKLNSKNRKQTKKSIDNRNAILGFDIDTTQKITVVTQFLTSDGTDNGDLKEVRRFYVQNGQVIQNSKVKRARKKQQFKFNQAKLRPCILNFKPNI